MRTLLIALGIFAASSCIIIFLIVAHQNKGLPYLVQQSAAVTIILLLIMLLSLRVAHIRTIVFKQGKWSLLFFGNILVQLAVLATGGIYSPFFMLLYLFILTVSLFFTLSTSLVFIGFTFFNLTIVTLLNHDMVSLVKQDPNTLLLYGISFATIIPLSQIIAHRYHVKETLLSLLNYQIKVEESIIAEINELVFITDRDTHILSVNDIVERTLRKSQSELTNKLLFDVLYVKDTQGNLLTKNTPAIQHALLQTTSSLIPDVSLLVTASPMRNINLQIKPISNFQNEVEHITFIITESSKQPSPDAGKHKNLENARIKHDAFVEDLKRRLLSFGQTYLATRLMLIAKIEQDILHLRTIEDHGIAEKKVRMDVANLCKQIVANEQELAEILRVSLTFSLSDFGEKDLLSIITKPIIQIAPEQTTGPFFSAPCDVTYLELTVQKLIEVALFLSSGTQNSAVLVSIGRTASELLVRIEGACPPLTQGQKSSLFTLYYDQLYETTNLKLGSGLEGFLAKTVADYLTMKLDADITSNQQCIFTLRINKSSTNP